MMQDESDDLSNNNTCNSEKDGSELAEAIGSHRRFSVNSYSEVCDEDAEDLLSSDNYDIESVAASAGRDNDGTDVHSDSRSTDQPEVKVKTLVEYHLEFLTKHPGEVFFYGCKLCTNRFTSRNSFLIHMKLHNVRKRYPCQHCDKAYDRKFQLVHHLQLHKEETPFECGVCFIAYATEIELIEHSKIHRSEKPFECRYCLKGFPQKKALIVHLRMHTGERPFHCPLCERTFTQKAHLQGHMVRIHIPKNKDPSKSSEAQAAIDKANTALLLNSIFPQKHHRESRFDEPHDLSSHSETTESLPKEIDLSILSGQREKLIECDYCDKKFTYERNKINHMRKHGYMEGMTRDSLINNTHSNSNNTITTMHQCGLCRMSFSSTALLMAHVLTHSNNNLLTNFGNSSNLPFHCDICGREFNMKRNLIMHVKSHNNERPHQCPACEKNFKLKYFLELHVSKIHPHINMEDLGKRSSNADNFEEDEEEKMDFTTSSAMPAKSFRPEKQNSALNLMTNQPAPNKRKQSQPKKVVMRTDLYETDSDTSYGEPYTDGSEAEDTDMEQDEDERENMMRLMEQEYKSSSFASIPLNLQQQPKKDNSYNKLNVNATAKSMQINLPHDLQQMKNMFNTTPDSEPHTTLSCPLCFLVVSSRAALAVHIKEHERNKINKCTMCEKVYIQQASFEKHMKKHLLGEIEAKQTKLEQISTNSIGRFEGRKPLECNICKKKYAQPASFEKHMRLHSELGDIASAKMEKSPFEHFESLKNSSAKSSGHNIANNEKAFINPSDFLEVSINH